MIAVYYSLATDPSGTRERQWARSVESLRRYNQDISVVLCLYGGARAEVIEAAGRTGVEIVPMGEFADALGDIPPHWRAALATFPTLHKLLSLRGAIPAHSVTRVIYLDCDTYFFDDVASLGTRYGSCDWYAREEPGSSRSHHGYDPRYLDEQALAALARSLGLVQVPPYNTGVVVLGAALARTLATLLDDFIWYAWRLLVGMCLWSPGLMAGDTVAHLVRDRSGPGDRRLALPYPSSNPWIIEEIATWLTLGRVPGMSHALLRRDDVAQSNEYAARPDGLIVAHYFTSAQDQFFAYLEGRK
jgi:hypothetical protein